MSVAVSIAVIANCDAAATAAGSPIIARQHENFNENFVLNAISTSVGQSNKRTGGCVIVLVASSTT